MQRQLAGSPVPLVAVGFSPPDALGSLADHLGLRGRILADRDRVLYRTMGLGRARLWRVYSPGTVAFYAGQVLCGRKLHKPVEDTRQLGGDAVCVDGVITRIWRPGAPDDRADPARIAAAAGVVAR